MSVPRIIFLLLPHFLSSLNAEGPTTEEGVLSINRHFQGDIFMEKGCNASSFCSSQGEAISPGGCECQCKTDYPIYREDKRTCVKDFSECMLADFISGSASEKIPFVFMPLPGQLIYPSAEIAISDVDSSGNPVLAPICVVSGVDILEAQGWKSFQNISGNAFQQPFQLHRNDDKTFLQWLGDDKLRKLLEGRLVLVHLLCKDTIRHPGKQLFSPCVAFRVAGTPGPDLLPSILLSETSRGIEEDGLSFGDYLAIGVCVAFLGIIYILAIIFFILMKRKRRRRKERLRRQFLKPPSTLPPGLRHKSSVLLGLESAFISELQSSDANSSSSHGSRGVEGPSKENTSSLGTTRMDEPVYDITKQGKKKDSNRRENLDFQETAVLQRNDKLLDAASKQVGKGRGRHLREKKGSENSEGILEHKSPDKEMNEHSSSEFFSKIRFLVRSARARMKVSYSPELTDIPEEIHTPKSYKNPAFSEEDSNFHLNRRGSRSSSTNFQSFNDVNAKLYRSFRDKKKKGGEEEEEEESSDVSSHEDSLDKHRRRRPQETNDPLSLDSGVVTNGSVSPISTTTNDHHHGSSSCSSPQESPETLNESNCNETDDEVVDVASEDTDSSDNDGYFDSLQRPGESQNEGIVETISPQFKTSFRRKAASPRSSIRKPNSIVPNYLAIPPSGSSGTRHRQDSMDLLTKLYDKAVLKIPKVIPSDNESLYSDRSNTMKSLDHDSLDHKIIRQGPPSRNDEDSAYEIIECPQDRPGVYINDMYSPDTLDNNNDRKKSSKFVGDKMILSVSGAPTKSNTPVFSNKLLIAVDYSKPSSESHQARKQLDRSFDPDTLERGEHESFKAKKKKKPSFKVNPPDLPPKINVISSPKSFGSIGVPVPPPPPPPPPPIDGGAGHSGCALKSKKPLPSSPAKSMRIDIHEEEEDALEKLSFQERREKLEHSFQMRRPESSSVLKRIRETEKGEYCGSVPAEGVSKGMEIALNIRSRVANQQNSLKKTSPGQIIGNKDSFKSSWRKTVEFVGGTGTHREEGRSLKHRPEDSGYISTDSSTDSRLRSHNSSKLLSPQDFDPCNQSESSLSSLDDNFEASLCDPNRPATDSILTLSYRPLQSADIRTYKL